MRTDLTVYSVAFCLEFGTKACRGVVNWSTENEREGMHVSMDEKSAVVLAQYDITVRDSYRARGACFLRTPEGLMVLRNREAKEGRVIYEEAIKEKGVENGFFLLDRCVKNREGNYVTEGDYGETFLVRRWREGCEADLQNSEDAVTAARWLGRFHAAMRTCPVLPEYIQTRPDEAFRKRIREMRRMETYLWKRKQKNPFELRLLEELPTYRRLAEKVLTSVPASLWQMLAEQAVTEGLICHGNYGTHSMVMLPHGVFVTDFEHACIGIQVTDLHYLMRKTMEKNDWDFALWQRMYEAYVEERPLSEQEKSALACLLRFPEKFARVCNKYFNSKKAWIPGKNAQKLLMVLEQKQKKEAFERKMGCILEANQVK